MKKLNIVRIISFLFVFLFFACSFSGCSAAKDDGGKDAAPVVIKIGAIQGPTGMGMTALFREEYNGLYNISLSGSPTDTAAQFISGEIDIAAVAVNQASVLYNKLEGDVQVIAVNTLGVLYVLENGTAVQSFADLSGRTVTMAGQGATPEYIMKYLLAENGLTDKVTLDFRAEQTEAATALAGGEVDIAVLPEPSATSAQMKNTGLSRALDLTAEWNKVTDTELVQGCLVVRKSFYAENKEAVDNFLADYEESVNYVNENPAEAASLMEENSIIPSAAIAEAAIPNCHIVYITGETMKADLSAMLSVLYSFDPSSIGGSLPDDDFYAQ